MRYFQYVDSTDKGIFALGAVAIMLIIGIATWEIFRERPARLSPREQCERFCGNNGGTLVEFEWRPTYRREPIVCRCSVE